MLEDLFQRARAGDTRAEGELFRQLYVRFVRFAGHRVGRDEAEDVAQKACLSIYEKYRTESVEVSYAAWAYGVFKYTLLRAGERVARERSRFEAVENLEGLAVQPAPNPLLEGWVLDCFRAILKRHARYARILNLRRLGYDTDEVCRRVGVSSEQYYVYLNRGRNLLKACLSERGVAV